MKGRVIDRARLWGKWLLFPGLDVATRKRIWRSGVPLRWWPSLLRQGMSGMAILAGLPVPWLDLLLPSRSHLCIYVQAPLQDDQQWYKCLLLTEGCLC